MKKILVGTLILSMVLGTSLAFADSPPEIYQSLTGKTVEELHEMREEGKTLWEAAEEEGVLEDLIEGIYEDAEEKLSAAVEEGKITQEEADEKLANLKERLENGDFPRGGHGPKKELTDEEKEDILDKAQERLSSAVEEGKMTQEEADERLEELEEKLENGDFKRGHGPKKELTDEEKEDILNKAKERLDNDVEEGKMTQEEADERLENLEERLENGNFRKERNENKELTDEEKEAILQKAEEKHNELVEEGKISQDEADERMENLRERLESGDFRGPGPRGEGRPEGERGKDGSERNGRPQQKRMNMNSSIL